MRSEKGFTLIELLAVIVILAVIALIATPIIMNVIHDSKKGAAKDSMYGYIKAVELASTKVITATTSAPTGTYTTRDGDLYQNSTKILDVEFKGTKPKDGGTVTLTNGNVVSATLTFDETDIKYEPSGTDESNSGESYNIGAAVYFDPTGAVSDCKAGKEWTQSNTKTTCYKWNVIKDNGASIEMLLDHNTTPTVDFISTNDCVASGGTLNEYNACRSTTYGPVTVMKQLKIDTENFSKVETLTSSDNVVREGFSGKKYTLNYAGMKARLISAEEIAKIIDAKTWTAGTFPLDETENSYLYEVKNPWLYQNLGYNEIYGYWTDTAYETSDESSEEYAWNIIAGKLENSEGKFFLSLFEATGPCGVRPVVRVLKSNI